MGGSVSGGAALKSLLQKDDVRDYDVFFPNISSFVKAHLAVYNNPIIDICLYENKPYELFDLGICKCAYSLSGFDVSEECKSSINTGISDIELGAIVHPTATLRRIIKYGTSYKIRFPGSKILILATTDGVDQSIAKEALGYAAW